MFPGIIILLIEIFFMNIQIFLCYFHVIMFINSILSSKMSLTDIFDFSAEYFIPIKNYSYGIPLKCNNSTNTDGKIIVCNSKVSCLI